MNQRFEGKADLFFILGADALRDLPTWNDAEECFNFCQFIGAIRPGLDKKQIEMTRNYFGKIGYGKIHSLSTFELAISATEIRKRVREKQSIRYIVPDEVAVYIKKEGLYVKEHESISKK